MAHKPAMGTNYVRLQSYADTMQTKQDNTADVDADVALSGVVRVSMHVLSLCRTRPTHTWPKHH